MKTKLTLRLPGQVFALGLILIIVAGCTLQAPGPVEPASESIHRAAVQTLAAAELDRERLSGGQPVSSPEPAAPANEGIRGADSGPAVVRPEAIAAAPLEEAPAFAAPQGLSAEHLADYSPTRMPDPLKFTFPTQSADSVSLWRAPLYPVPWEPTPNDHFYFTRPIGANEVNWPLARYRYGYLLYSEPHSGIDIPSPKGTPILAAGPGTVIWAGYGLYFQRNIEQDPYGIAVAIKHDFGHRGQTLYTVYGHMQAANVIRGQRVQGGETIGWVGETGKVTGPHLHFEVRVGEDTYFTIRNPELWIAPPQGTGVLVGRLLQYNGDKAPRVKVQLRSLQGKGSFEVTSYAENDVNCDEYYNENLVLGDIPAGDYQMFIDYNGEVFRTAITIQAGLVNYFTYHYRGDVVLGPPPTPEKAFIPPDFEPGSTPPAP